MNKSKPFIALPFSGKLNKNLEINNIKDNLILDNDVNKNNKIKCSNSMYKDCIDDKKNYKENTGLLNHENQCKYCCYDFNYNFIIFKNLFLSNEINFDKN